MAAPFSRVLSKTDDAIVAFLQSMGVSGTILPGKSSLDKSAPCTIVHCSAAKEDPPFTGNYIVDCAIIVKSIGATDAGEEDSAAKTSHDTLTATVFDAIKAGSIGSYQDLAGAINDLGLTDYTVLGIVEEGQEAGQAEDCWVETINLKITCCCSTIPDE